MTRATTSHAALPGQFC